MCLTFALLNDGFNDVSAMFFSKWTGAPNCRVFVISERLQFWVTWAPAWLYVVSMLPGSLAAVVGSKRWLTSVSSCSRLRYSMCILSTTERNWLTPWGLLLPKLTQTSICIAHRRKPLLMRSRMARVRGSTRATHTYICTNGMNHPAFTP